MKYSHECEEYEVYSKRCRAKEPFPIEAHELVRYIRYRGRSKTFRKFLVNLEVHPLHGSEWLKKMMKNDQVLQEMRRVIKKWKFNLADTLTPLVGVDYSMNPSYYDVTESDEEEERVKKLTTTIKSKKTIKNKETKTSSTRSASPPRFPNVYSVSGPKTKGASFVY